MPDTTPTRPAMTMREIRDRLGHARPDTTPTTPAVWSEGDPLMEAMAAAVYKQCASHPEQPLTVDDPRTIAAVAATVARLVLGTTDQQPAVDPADDLPAPCKGCGEPWHKRHTCTTDQQPETADCTCITAPEVDDSGQVLHGSYCMTVIDQQPETAPDTGLRDRIAQVLLPWLLRVDVEDAADAVLAVLPTPVDRAAVLREGADAIDATFTGFGIDRYVRHGADLLRRVAEQQPETEACTCAAAGAAFAPAGHYADCPAVDQPDTETEAAK